MRVVQFRWSLEISTPTHNPHPSPHRARHSILLEQYWRLHFSHLSQIIEEEEEACFGWIALLHDYPAMLLACAATIISSFKSICMSTFAQCSLASLFTQHASSNVCNSITP
jgi:hypothetical protein